MQAQRILFWDSNLILEQSEKVGLPTGVQYEIRNFLKDKYGNTASDPAAKNGPLGEFMSKWVTMEQALYRLAELTYPPDHNKGQKINVGPIPGFLARDKTLTRDEADEIDQLRGIRNQVVHGEIDHKTILTTDLMTRMQTIYTKLEKKLSELEQNK
jgi:hypothetical protein